MKKYISPLLILILISILGCSDIEEQSKRDSSISFSEPILSEFYNSLLDDNKIYQYGVYPEKSFVLQVYNEDMPVLPLFLNENKITGYLMGYHIKDKQTDIKRFKPIYLPVEDNNFQKDLSSDKHLLRDLEYMDVISYKELRNDTISNSALLMGLKCIDGLGYLDLFGCQAAYEDCIEYTWDFLCSDCFFFCLAQRCWPVECSNGI